MKGVLILPNFRNQVDFRSWFIDLLFIAFNSITMRFLLTEILLFFMHKLFFLFLLYATSNILDQNQLPWWWTTIKNISFFFSPFQYDSINQMTISFYAISFFFKAAIQHDCLQRDLHWICQKATWYKK